jgi:hypothetical protein
MANPYQAWEQAQERHITQVRGVIWTFREASRIATIPGEDQDGYSKRAVEEGRRAFFQSIDSIRVEKEANKPNAILTGVKLEADKDMEMQTWPVDIRKDATGARPDNIMMNNGGEQVQINNCHMNDSDRNKIVFETTHHITKPDSNFSNSQTTVASGETSANIAQTGPHDSTAMQQRPRVADLVSSYEPQLPSFSSGLSMNDGFCLGSPQTRAAQVATFTPDKPLAIEAPIERPGILQTLQAMEKRLAAHKVTAQRDGFERP